MAPDPATYEVTPAEGPLDGDVPLPGSKSLTNRALCLGALAEGASRLDKPLLADDTLYMVAGLKNLGFKVRKPATSNFIQVQGRGGRIPWDEGRVWAGAAGTVLRFLLAVLPLGEGVYTIDGDARLRKRPIADLVEALRGLGADIELLGAGGRALPARVKGGGGLAGGAISIPGGVSSQFLSALLMAGPVMQEGLDVRVEGTLTSRPYADLTLRAMSAFGVDVERQGYERFRVPRATYRGMKYTIEGDASASTYFLAAGAVCGGRVKVTGVGSASVQADTGFARVLETMGAEVQSGPDWIEVRGRAQGGGVFDLADMPDAAQTLAVTALFASEPVEIRNVGNLRVKETDRIHALCAELRKLGGRVEEYDDGLKVHPGASGGARIETYNDHRMAMAFSVAGLALPGVVIEDPGTVSKSFPDFYERLETLTGRKGKRER